MDPAVPIRESSEFDDNRIRYDGLSFPDDRFQSAYPAVLGEMK
jgi:hypothetical protein